jgi:hypothetical protein
MEKDELDLMDENILEEGLKNIKLEIENKCEGILFLIRFFIF